MTHRRQVMVYYLIKKLLSFGQGHFLCLNSSYTTICFPLTINKVVALEKPHMRDIVLATYLIQQLTRSMAFLLKTRITSTYIVI